MHPFAGRQYLKYRFSGIQLKALSKMKINVYTICMNINARNTCYETICIVGMFSFVFTRMEIPTHKQNNLVK